MKDLKIAHLSDTHILRQYGSEELIGTVFAGVENPAETLAGALAEIASFEPDVIVITGDLIHEGLAEDYAHLAKLLEKHAPKVPILPALGNHDRKKAFFEGFLGESEAADRFYRADTIQGVRFLTLDTATEGDANGSLSPEQYQWLREELATPAEHGTILLGHHPFASRFNWFRHELPDGFAELVKGSDVLCYLCGHTHYNETRTLWGMPQLTADACAFGVECDDTYMLFSKKRGYSLYTLSGDGIIAANRALRPHEAFLARSPLH